jgi:hypothetical protein
VDDCAGAVFISDNTSHRQVETWISGAKRLHSRTRTATATTAGDLGRLAAPLGAVDLKELCLTGKRSQ